MSTLLDTASLIVTPNGVKSGKLYSVVPSSGAGDLDVTRATTATRVNSAGLVELVPYNLFTYSEQFDNSDWNKNNVTIIANSTISPDGTLTADTITNSSTGYGLWQFITVSPNTEYTFSFYVKKGTNTSYILSIIEESTFTNLASLDYTSQVETNWVRISITFTTLSSSSVIRVYPMRDGISTGTAFLWGAQVVQGTLPKDYLQTTTRLNIPRLDYSNGSCPSILVEPQRTNLALRSQEFDNSHWVKFNGATITANTITSPDGTINADTLNTASSQEIYASMGAKAIGSITYTFSCFAKYSNASELQIQASDFATSASIGYFNLQTGIATFTQGSTWSGTSVKMENYGNGWYRCIMTSTSPVTPALYVSLLTTASGSAYIYGTQTEQGSYATSYIPTTSASVTRNADVISKTGISSLIGQTEGTIFIDANISVRDTTRVLADIQDGTNNDSFQIVLYGNSLNVIIYDGGVLQAALNGGFCLGRKKIALGYKLNDFVLYIDGVQISTDISGTIPITSLIALGNLSIASGYELGDSINLTALWKTRLTNTQLEQLTTI